jgi:hypothetical protein
MTTPLASPLAPPKPKRRWGLIIGIGVAAILALIAVLVVGAILLVNASTKDAQKVSDQFVVAVQNGDGAKAYALGGPSFRAAATQEQITQLAKSMAPLVTKAKVAPNGKAISASTGNGKIAVFTYTMHGSRTAKVYWKTEIKKEGGRWQVFNFRSAEKPLGTDVE